MAVGSNLTNIQLYLAIGVPVLANAVIIGLLMAYTNAKLDAMRDDIKMRFEGVDHRFQSVDNRFDGVNQRFDDMRGLWLAELHRVEEVLDARLRHIEQQ